MNSKIELKAITKRYGSLEVLTAIDLSIAEGAFTSLLGASGCGKTTLLNLVAGLDEPTSGEIAIDGVPVFSKNAGYDVPPHRRNIGYVFQSYALWPHMRVIDNVSYPLRVRGMSVGKRDDAAREMLDRLEIGELTERFPFELSGGQQQRVAIARALIHKPQVLLLDEPLSNLDAQLRERARTWIAKVHSEFKLTTVLVTHDHIEGLSLSDRIVLMRNGRIEQDDSPSVIYEKPSTIYVADFIGGVNAFGAKVESSRRTNDGMFATGVLLGGDVRLRLTSDRDWQIGANVQVAIRPSHISLAENGVASREDEVVMPLRVTSVQYQGDNWDIQGEAPVGEIRLVAGSMPGEGPKFVRFRAEDCRCIAK